MTIPMIKGGVWETILQTTFNMSLKPRHDYDAPDSIFIACGNVLADYVTGQQLEFYKETSSSK